MGFGSVSSEIKGKRNMDSLGWNQSLLKITEEGATFRSYIDGSIHNLTPELSIKIQTALGADIIVVLDECTPYNVDKEYTAASMLRSHRWAIRSLNEFQRTSTGSQALYGIVQGGVYEDLRLQSANFVNETPFFGAAIGGSLGATKECMNDIVAYTRSLLRNDRPVHLLGIGGIRDIFKGVKIGIDTFDCVHPTRLGRHGGALVKADHWREDYDTLSRHKVREHIRVDKSRMREDPRPIDVNCMCYTCRNFSRAYLHHLFKTKEILGSMLVTTHNIHFMNKLMEDIRKGIRENNLAAIESEYIHPNLHLLES
jgi:queuine tRNA-ribosyltransferase